ncbi:hypothetical protein J2T19_004179 [Paenibacillus tundrae]|uniref:Uncharacterized protein n=1 Tax=Paenibacillus tundrae TaxID=528187 RepID=A0ABT9WHD6_9BACL|nr:hypothetical protein [Paenibacillus tundrae]
MNHSDMVNWYVIGRIMRLSMDTFHPRTFYEKNSNKGVVELNA